MKHRSFPVALVGGALLLLVTCLGALGCSSMAAKTSSGGASRTSRARLTDPAFHAMSAGAKKSTSRASFGRDSYVAGYRHGAPVIHSRSHVKPVGTGKTATWKRSGVRANTSRLMIGDKEDLPLKAMQATVKVDGFRARVLLDLYYHNPHRRQYEGTFKVRLPEGASPYYLAFGDCAYRASDVASGKAGIVTRENVRKGDLSPRGIIRFRRSGWSRVKEARMVPRAKAAHAYRQTVHVRRVDPALMEWSGGGVFTARVFPIFPRKIHRIVIGYDVDLIAAGEDLEYRLDLPEKVPNLVVDLDVFAPRGEGVAIKPFSSPLVQQGRAHYRFTNPREKTVTVRLRRPGALLLSGSDEAAGDFFAAAFRPQLPTAAADGGADRAIIMLDTSLSSSPDKFNVYLKLLEQLLEKNRDSIKQFAVMFFDISPRWWRRSWTANTPAAVSDLLARARTLPLEGATDLGSALSAAAEPNWLRGDAAKAARDIFLLSDGAVTWGEDDPHALSASLGDGYFGSLFAYRTGMAGTDRRALEHLARASGGAVFAAVSEDELGKVARAHRSRSWQIESVALKGTGDLLLAGRPRSIFPGQRLLLVGRGKPAIGAKCLLTLRQGDRRKVLAIPFARRIASKLAGRAYGQVAVGQLEELGVPTERQAKAYAVHFRVTGRSCSLLMLESERDYQRFNIRPEGEARVVRDTAAEKLIAAALAASKNRLGNPKTAFLASLMRLEKTAGVQFRAPAELLAAVKDLPPEVFEVKSRPVLPGALEKRRMGRSYREMIAKGKADYAVAAQEAEHRARRVSRGDALRALSSLVEANPGNGVLVRDVGFSAMQWGYGGHAYHLFRKRAAARPNNPQNYHAMGLCLSELGRADLAMACFEIALAGRWDARFGDIHGVVALDYLQLLRAIEKKKLKCRARDFALVRMRSIADRYDVGRADLVVAINWNTDATDVDLHVTEPTGEVCSYKRRRTRIGGAMTRDVTRGYGPEMYVIKHARAGRYRVRAYYYSSDRNRASMRTKVYATIVTGWGTDQERIDRRAVSMGKARRFHDVATVVIDG